MRLSERMATCSCKKHSGADNLSLSSEFYLVVGVRMVDEQKALGEGPSRMP